MKKLFFAAMMVAVSSSTFAQNPKIDKDVKAAGTYDAGLQVLKGQLAGLTAEQKAKGYNQLVEMEFPEATKTFMAFQAGQGASANYAPIYNVIMSAVEADIYDNQPNDKGKVAPKFHKKNIDRLKDLRVLLIVNGQNVMNSNADEGIKYLGAYVNSSTSSLFNEVAGEKDQNRGNVARVVAYLYAQKEQYETAKQYAEIAMNDTASRNDTKDIYVAILDKMMKTHEDSVNYVNKLKEIDAEKYFARMVSLLDRIGEKEQAAKLLDEEIARNPQNKMAYAIKGESAMSARDWDAAIDAFKKTVEIDPKFTAVWFNLGVCASSKGFDLNEKYSDKQGKIKTDDAAKVKAVLVEAAGYYEKVKELDPNYQEIPNWPRQLRMVYNAIGETEKANEISKMLGE